MRQECGPNSGVRLQRSCPSLRATRGFVTDPFLVVRKRRAPAVSNGKQNFATARLRPIGAFWERLTMP